MLALRTSVTAVALLVVGKPATSLLETNGSFSPVYELRRPGFKLTLFSFTLIACDWSFVSL